MQEEGGCRGGSTSWEACFRIMITTAIPSMFSNSYLRGIQDIDVFFQFPVIFRAMLGSSIRMRGRLRWDGRRPSRGQLMGFIWML